MLAGRIRSGYSLIFFITLVTGSLSFFESLITKFLCCSVVALLLLSKLADVCRKLRESFFFGFSGGVWLGLGLKESNSALVSPFFFHIFEFLVFCWFFGGEEEGSLVSRRQRKEATGEIHTRKKNTKTMAS